MASALRLPLKKRSEIKPLSPVPMMPNTPVMEIRVEALKVLYALAFSRKNTPQEITA